jgi:hypothetical protein
VRILAVYLSPSWPLLDTDLSTSLGGGLLVLMAGDLNAKHMEWNSREIMRRGRLLRDYADKNSCLIYGPNSSTTVPYKSFATPDVLDIVTTKDLSTPVHLTCSALKSDLLPILIDTECRSSFLNLPDRLDLRKTDWSKFQACLESGMPSIPNLPDEASIDACVKGLTTAISKALADSTLKCRQGPDPWPSIPAHIQDEICLKNRLWRQWQATRDPTLKAGVNRLQRSVTNQLNEWRNDQWSNMLESLDPEDQSLW